MIPGLLGIKKRQSQTFTEDGKRIPITDIVVGPCWVIDVLDIQGKRYLQIAMGEQKRLSKPLEGTVRKAGIEKTPRFLRQFTVSSDTDLPPGSIIRVSDVFAKGDRVRVTGTSKGKGFAGVVRRHGFAGGPRTHGQSDRERAPGAIGAGTTPGRIYKGKRMAGRMGGGRVTVPGLAVVDIDPERNFLRLKGLVPGALGGLLIIQKEN